MTGTTERQMCRNPRCRSRLPAPVSNPREAFCARGCHTQFYRKRCIACEQPMERKRESQQLCGRRKCEGQFKTLKAYRMLGRYHPSSAALDPSRNSTKPGTFSRATCSPPKRTQHPTGCACAADHTSCGASQPAAITLRQTSSVTLQDNIANGFQDAGAKWKDQQLYYFSIPTGIRYQGDPGLFRVVWPDGTLSADYYNLARVKQHCRDLAHAIYPRQRPAPSARSGGEVAGASDCGIAGGRRNALQSSKLEPPSEIPQQEKTSRPARQRPRGYRAAK